MAHLTHQQIIQLANNPTQANITALQKELASREKMANIRLKAIEKYAKTKKSNMDYISKFAYGLTKEYLSRAGLEYFDSSTRNPQSLKIQLNTLNKFLSEKTSTVKGIRSLEKANRKQFNAMGIHIKRNEEAKFFEFISSNFVQDIKSIGSERIFEQVLEAIRSGKTIEDMEQAYEKYKTGEIEFIDTAWESWTEVSPFGD